MAPPSSRAQRPTAAAPRPALEAFSTDLRQQPVYRLYARLYEGRASGHLDLTRGQVRRRLTFHFGQIRYAASNLAQENAGGMQVAAGTLDQGAFRQAVAHAKGQRVPLADALAATGAMSAHAAAEALAAQVQEIAVASVGWGDGTASYQPDPQGAAAVPDHKVHPLAAVVDGVRRFYDTAALQGFLGARRAVYLHPTPLMQRETYILRSTTPGERLTILVDGSRTVGEVLDESRTRDLPLLFALVATGLARLDRAPMAEDTGESGAGTPAAAPVAPAAQARAPAAPVTPAMSSAPARAFNAEEQDARERIAAEHERLAEATHYQVLGVGPGADAEAVQKAYLERARTWHTDRFAGLELGDAAPSLEEIFQKIGEAKRVLTDPDAHKEYEVYLDRKAKGLPTDVAAILKAEDLFQQGERLLKAGRVADALAHFEEAISLNHTEAEFYAYRGYARYLAEGNASLGAAKQDLDRALASDRDMASAHYLLGMMALKEGDAAEAEKRFRRTVECDASHAEAQQQLRVMKMREEKEKGGLFGRRRKK